MRRDSWIQLGAGAAMVAMLAVSAALSTQIAASSGRNRLVYTDTAEEGDPPQVALGIAMGAFKGVFVNYLWIRANDLKEQGKYYEAIDLASTITKLQPRFPRVWAFHAWNLSYNISVATQTPHERWQWVQSGINLLRDEGIPANPSDLLLHKELAWIFMHKIQGVMDDANQYYKRQFAREWQIVLGPPPARGRDDLNTEKASAQYADWMRRIADAHGSIEALYAAEPAAQRLVARLKVEAGLDPTDFRSHSPTGALAILEMTEQQRSLGRVLHTLGVMVQRDGLNEAALNLMIEPEFFEAWRALDRYMRKRVLIDVYHMEPERMVRYTLKYGPLDWRHASAHAVYWSARGVEESLQRITDLNRDDFDIVNTDRVTIQAIQDLYRTGDITFDLLNPEFFLQLPNPNYIDVYTGILEELRARSRFDVKERIYTLYAAGYENFLRDAIRFLYRRGDIAEARKYHTILLDFPRLNDNDPFKILQLSAPLEEFVKNEIVNDNRFTTPDVARGEVVASLQSAFIAGLLAGNDKVFRAQMDYARAFHKLYTDKQVFDTTVSRSIDRRLEVMSRDFDEFAGEVFAAVVVAVGFPDGPIMYARASPALQQHSFVRLERTSLKTELDAAAQGTDGMGFEAWFAPPAGVELIRARFEQQHGPPNRVELK